MTHSPDFLKHQDVSIMVRPQRWLFWFVLVFLLIFIFGGFLWRPIKRGVRAWELVNQGKTELLEAQALGLESRFLEADSALVEASKNFEAAGAELAGLKFLRHFPWLGNQIVATENLLASGTETTNAVRDVLAFGNDLKGIFNEISLAREVLKPNLDSKFIFADFTPAEKRLILARVLSSIPKLEAAEIKVQEALVKFEKIPTKGLAAPLRAAISPLALGLPRLHDDLSRAIPIAKLLPALAGYPTSKHTLILFLNNAELRPGGGFIGTVGRLDVASGSIQSLVTRDAYLIDRPAEAFLDITPPEPLSKYLGLGRWFMRDANWSPDFAVAAETVTRFYEIETSGGRADTQIDNVIAFTPDFASEILAITGPILVQGENFNAENLFDLLEYQVERGFTEKGVPFEQRKEILADLVDSTIDALFNLPVSRFEELLAVLDQGFEEKHLLLYDRNSELQAQIETQGWGGRLATDLKDFVMVVDANLGSLKSDPEVKRQIDYKIEPEGDNFLATVKITYRHEGNFDWKTTRYRTFTRLYVPEGSEFVSSSGALRDDKIKNPSREPGEVTVATDPDLPGVISFGAFTAIEPGEERALSFTYRLALQVKAQIKEGVYELKVQKQLGAFPHELTLDLDFGKTVMTAEPAEIREHFFDSTYEFRTDLAEDREFTVRF